MHFRERGTRSRALRTSTSYHENQSFNLKGSGHGGGLHSSPTLSAARKSIAVISRSDSGIATAGAAAQPNLPLQKLWLTLRCSDRHPVSSERRQEDCWYAPCRGPSTFHWQLNWLWSARRAMVPWGFATTVILRPPGRELDRDGGNRALPLCRGNRAWPQLRDEHPQWEDHSSMNATSACLLPRHVRQRSWPSPSARQRPHPETHRWHIVWSKTQRVFIKTQRQVFQMQSRR